MRVQLNGKVYDKEVVQNMIDESPAATARALLAIYARQTAAEQSSLSTIEHNSVGFCSRDAKWLTDIAQKYQRWGRWASDRQRLAVARAVKKYHRQLLEEIAAKPGAVVMDERKPRSTTRSATIENVIKAHKRTTPVTEAVDMIMREKFAPKTTKPEPAAPAYFEEAVESNVDMGGW